MSLKKNTEKSVKLCVCPDEEVMHTFSLQALAFDTEAGMRLTVKVSSIKQAGVCNSTQPISKLVQFTDLETKSIIIEVIFHILFYSI